MLNKCYCADVEDPQRVYCRVCQSFEAMTFIGQSEAVTPGIVRRVLFAGHLWLSHRGVIRERGCFPHCSLFVAH